MKKIGTEVNSFRSLYIYTNIYFHKQLISKSAQVLGPLAYPGEINGAGQHMDVHEIVHHWLTLVR